MKLPVAQSAFLSTSLAGSRAGSMRIIPVCPITVPHGCASMTRALLPSHPKTIRTGLYQPPKVTRVIRACLWSVAVIGNPPRPRTRPIPWSLWRVVFLSPKSRPPILPSRSQGSGTAIIERKRTAVISLPGSQPTGPCMRTGRCCWTGVS